MEQLVFDLTKRLGTFKPMNATNGGPRHRRHTQEMQISNFEDYKKARIPYTRNHDANICGQIYGGPYCVDITSIFPNFDADPYAAESYDFPCTDESILTPLDAGTETFYRLGQSIEHQIVKHGTIPPKDFHKWAVICEHIIRHYNEGWAKGFHLNIQYWEIWNEPDLDADDCPNKRTWGGTKAQFFDFYETAAKHLKGCFPHLKIGGPAVASDNEWVEATGEFTDNTGWIRDFLTEMKRREVPLDFFSWHSYCTEPEEMIKRSVHMKELLMECGYPNAESILNEWNYVKDWTQNFVYSIEVIQGMKGAAFTMACMSEAQKSSIDMLMYYDTRPSAFSGAFDYYTARPKKTYYAMKWYGMFYDCQAEVRCENQPEKIYTLCGVDEKGKTMAVITHYSEDDATEEKEVCIDFGRSGTYEVYLLDQEHNGEYICVTENLEFTLPLHSCIMIKEI